MPLPPILAGEANRLSTLYTAPLTFVLLVLLLAVLRRRAAQLRRTSHAETMLSAPSFLGRLPHILCCVAMSGQWTSYNKMTERDEFLYIKKTRKEIFEQSWVHTTDYLRDTIQENP